MRKNRGLTTGPFQTCPLMNADPTGIIGTTKQDVMEMFLDLKGQ
jgi:hypothetical protein